MSEVKLRRVLVLGLDGVTFTLLDPWIDQGKLPNIAALIKSGVRSTMKSALPPMTATGWTSIVTGTNPGKHGIFHFVDLVNQKGRPLSSIDVKAPSLWRILSDAGRFSVFINVPLTYPPQPIKGMLIPGLPVPASALADQADSKFAYPSWLSEELGRIGYEIEPPLHVELMTDRNSKIAFATKVNEITAKHSKLAEALLGNCHWDLFFIVFSGPDRIQHYFWRYLDKSHPLYHEEEALELAQELLRHHELVDSAVGRLVKSACNDDTVVFCISDHGFGPQYNTFFVNNWLLEEGLLRLRRKAVVKRALSSINASPQRIVSLLANSPFRKLLTWLARRVMREGLGTQRVFSFINLSDIDYVRTKAYSPAPNFVNLSSSSPEERTRLIASLKSELEALTDPSTGGRVIDRVLAREEVYSGPHVSSAPDLVLIPAMGFAAHSAFDDKNRVFGSRRFGGVIDEPCGCHNTEAVFIASGRGIRKNTQINRIDSLDVCPTILHIIGITAPDHLDGRILHEIFVPQ